MNPAPESGEPPLLAVRDLSLTLATGRRATPLLTGVSFDLAAGEPLGIVGASGAGKSLLARALLGLAPSGARVTGSALLSGRQLIGAGRRTHQDLWGRRMAFVPQDALAVLNPVYTVGDQLAAAIRSVRGLGRREAQRVAVAALDRVGIADARRRARSYPHEFSGGMRQRAVIAMALVNEPRLVVADEPTTALDPTVQRHVLTLLDTLREATGAALLLISHDLPVVAERASRMLVLDRGRVAEHGPTEEVLTTPRAATTRRLVAATRPRPRP
ncbi:ABC transporter ATP-binding protein, partial [Streptomyces sp. 8K308]|uniref:ABC transporter ATP-binding protein n=1 Tax=Streptomyces sp. 8K308 TaxID=2530388 RepID=UPI001053E63D